MLQSKEGKSPLHMAAIHGRFTRSQILIQNGRDDCAVQLICYVGECFSLLLTGL